MEAEIERLVREDTCIMEPVDTNETPIEWASPIVCVPKRDGTIRLYVNFKATINHVDPHPLPRFEDIVAKIGDSEYFSMIDLKDVFLQLEVDEPSRRFLVVSTHKAYMYFQYKPSPFRCQFCSCNLPKSNG